MKEQAVLIYQKTSQQGRREEGRTGTFFRKSDGEKGVYELRKKGQATQEKYKGVLRLWRQKIRKEKAQLELDMATTVKYNKTCLYKCINNKRRAEGNVRPLLAMKGNMIDEESAFFAPIFNRKTRATGPLRWQTGIGSRIEPLQSRGK